MDFSNLISIPLGLFGIGFLIGFHELGHFLFCKLFSIRTPSFSIGFGPKIFSKKIGDTEFIISPIPLGGFVEIAGAAEVGQGEQKEANSRDIHSFAVKPYYQKFFVMCGGIFFNLFFAYFVFTMITFTGIPKAAFLYPANAVPTIAQVVPDSAAHKASLQAGDTVLSFNETPIGNDVPLLIKLIGQSADIPVTINYERDGIAQSTTAVIDSRTTSGTTTGTLGVEFVMQEMPGKSLFESIKQGIHMTNEWIKRTMQGFISIFSRGEFRNLGGPLMVLSMTVKGAGAGMQIFLIWLALISINLAVLNMIPLPILDGGQLLFYTIEAILGRPLPIKVREYIHMVSWIFMLGLVVILSIHDVIRMAQPYLGPVRAYLGL